MAEGASAAMAEWAPSAWSLGTRTVCPSAPVSWPSHQIALQGRLPMSVRRRRKDWQLKFLPHNNGRAPNPRAVAHMNGKPAESRMQLRVIGTVDLACWGRAGDTIVHSANAGDHSLRGPASGVDRDHGGKSCPPQSSNRIDAEGSVFPHAGTHTRLGKFHYNGRNAADKKRKRVLEHTPRY